MSAQSFAATTRPIRRSRGGGIRFKDNGVEATTQGQGNAAARADSTLDLYWLPLGAGGRCVRWNGRAYEALMALWERRRAQDLYHSGLEVTGPQGRFVIEMTPIPDANGAERGVVANGAVGSRLAGHFRLFRYELRRWNEGVIPDVDEAVDSPVHLSSDARDARRLLELVPEVPTVVWGRDELRAGEMWNSNSVVSWLLARAGLNTDTIRPPAGGRAPGWKAGLVAAKPSPLKRTSLEVRKSQVS
jgi:hypothetical protein